MAGVTTYVDDLAVLTELIDTGNELDAVKVFLVTDAPALDPDMVIGDFTKATFTGSAAVSITWGTPYTGTEGKPQVDSQLVTFISTDAVVDENVVGIIVTDTAGTGLKFAALFDAPIPITLGKGVGLVIGYRRYDIILTQVP